MFRRTALLFVLLAGACLADGTMAFTVSMPQPANHTFHVMFRCDGLQGELQDFQLPQWSPGYYGIGDYSRNVSNFRAENAAGNALAWEKVTRNTWRIVAENAPVVVLSYDVFANVVFAANNYLGEDRAYLSPAALFVHPAGRPQHALTVTLDVPANWKQIATGLEPVRGRTNTFEAPDFDTLYDCPILIGNQEYYHFEVKGVPHFVAVENVAADVDRPKMVADLQTMVTAATQLMGEVPYKHYTFLMMGRGGGGIEHSNSSSNQFDGTTLSTPTGYLRWLSFICHEYFHNFNVKRIRPLALGPFDYDQENLTNMLWVSEGLSVYYQDLILVRAGLMTKEQYLAKLANAIGTFENASGHHYQSATESSQNTWNSGSGVAGDRNTTISYYNNGAMLGAMLDLSIRQGSGNRKSLDDVMRALYRKFYVTKKRGFTDAEFRAECESAAGAKLDEVFAYASTTKEVDYARYFALAGLKLDSTTEDAPGGFIGLDTDTQSIPPSEMPAGRGRGGRGGRSAVPAVRLVVTDVAADSPATLAGLKAGDRILEVNGAAATAPALNDAINSHQPGEKIRLHVERDGAPMDVEVAIARNAKKTYRLAPAEGADSTQTAILGDWLRKAQ
ncbi:MAG TPA: PDZ domain-containing protein [Bryobacteraceae bacterium]|jgi:predicted metalloprotease with PDZ domain|nr:PDZ domain-containing protein [Bryobacteraceae bacterium]